MTILITPRRTIFAWQFVAKRRMRDRAGDYATAEEALKQLAQGSGSSQALTQVRRWDSACQKLPDASLALISVAGEYAAELAKSGAGSQPQRDDVLR